MWSIEWFTTSPSRIAALFSRRCGRMKCSPSCRVHFRSCKQRAALRVTHAVHERFDESVDKHFDDIVDQDEGSGVILHGPVGDTDVGPVDVCGLPLGPAEGAQSWALSDRELPHPHVFVGPVSHGLFRDRSSFSFVVRGARAACVAPATRCSPPPPVRPRQTPHPPRG